MNHTKFATFRILFRAVAAVALLVSTRVWAQNNILVNTNFGANSGQAVATGWTYFEDPTIYTRDYWIGAYPTGNFYATPVSGTNYWKQWGAGYLPSANNVSGIYQTFGASAGAVYQANGWLYTSSKDGSGFGSPNFNSYAWLDVSFLNSSGNMLALYQSATFNATNGMDAWYYYQVTNVCNLSAPISTGDPYYTNYAVSGAVASLTAPTGTSSVRYRFNLLQYEKEGGSVYLDDPALNQYSGLIAPIISNVVPQNMIFFAPSNGLTFDVSSPSGSTINNNAIHLILNGVDVSGSLEITGSSSNKEVGYFGLQSNTIYSASIMATDAFGLGVGLSNYFQTTWVGIPPIQYLWEAEDFDFTNGMYIDYPDLCNAPGDSNCYYGTVGTYGVDENFDGESVAHLYRPDDFMNIQVSGDLLRQNLVLASRTDYEINPFEQGEWVNYTRDFTNGTYWIIARIATDINLAGQLTMSTVNPDSSTTTLGTFTITNGLGWTTFENIFLQDTNGNKVNVPLNGKTTLRVTSGGNLLPTFYALVEATVDEPILSGMYPDGNHPFEYTNALSFNISTIGATFPASGINVSLDGFNVNSNLVITGSSSNETVQYPNLLLNAIHTAVISVTNSLGHGFRVTNNFDTFNPNNYMVEASDFDFNGGQYIPDSQFYPNAYEGYTADTNIDFQHTTIGGEQYPYRPNGIPQEQGSDYLTPLFVDYGGIEFDLGDYGPGDWQNYTRDYTNGAYYIYARTAGLGAFSMTLDKVVSGAGTTNQAIQTLGQWDSVGLNNSTYQWVELTDNGLAAPQVVDLNGVTTLRVSTSTGFVYPNYFMFVPATGIRLSASRQGANASISFPSQDGVVYRVFSRSSLTSGNWTLLTTVMGTGGVQQVSFSANAGPEFYKIVAP